MVYSRPIWSETQPNSGRAPPFAMLSMISAAVSVDAPKNTIVFATLKSLRYRRDLGRCHKSAGGNHDEHHVENPEYR